MSSKIAQFWSIKSGLRIALLVIICFESVLLYKSLDQPSYGMTYNVGILSNQEKILQVDLKIHMVHGSFQHNLQLVQGNLNLFADKCTDQYGNRINVSKHDKLIIIPIKKNQVITYSYMAKLGDIQKHGYRSQLYDDLLVLDGEHMLAFPTETYMKPPIKKNIKKLTINFKTPVNWMAMIPFTEQNSKLKPSITVASPTWSDFNTLKRTCYAFGRFEKKVFTKNHNLLNIYVDKKYHKSYSPEIELGLNAIYDFYSNLFGKSPSNLSIVLLRKDPKDNTYLMGGESYQGIGTTFDPDNPRDWELMGHRMFHAFFEANIQTTSLYFPPNLWFYEGLTTYYENISMNSLPVTIRKKLKISVPENFRSLFRRYVYMRLKDSSLFSITPMHEESLVSQGKIEFLHYTQAPLMIKMLEDISFTKYGSPDRLLRYICSHSSESLSLEKLLKYTVGEEYPSISKNFFYSDKEILPLWYLFDDHRQEDPQVIVDELNYSDYLYWTWFVDDDPLYPADHLSLYGLKDLSKAAQIRHIHFSNHEIESNIKKISPTMYDLLMQYALRAKVCNQNYGDPSLRYKLFNDDTNKTTWEKYVRSYLDNQNQ